MKTITSDKVVYSLDKNHEPVLEIESGEEVRFQTCDCFSNEIETEEDLIMDIDFTKINPATGPVFVKDANPGDILKVTIEKINIKDQGVVAVAKDFGLLGDLVKEPKTRVVEIKNNKAYFLEKEIPMRKMIGVIGNAPEGEGVETGTPGAHGGNMDTTLIQEGSTLYLPVNVEGALFALGDLHGAMGDGEIGVSGLEIPGEVDVKIEVLKDKKLPVPFLETEDLIVAIASDPDHKQAAYNATKNMAEFLVENTKLEIRDAIMLLSISGDLKVSQVVNSSVTYRMELPKRVYENYK